MVEETDLLLYQSNSLRSEDLSRGGNHTLQICSRVPLSGFYLHSREPEYLEFVVNFPQITCR